MSETLKSLNKTYGNNIILVFGCGDDRDKKKRKGDTDTLICDNTRAYKLIKWKPNNSNIKKIIRLRPGSQIKKKY